MIRPVGGVRWTTDQMMRAAIAEDWPAVQRIARQLRSMANTDWRSREVDRWLRANGANCPQHVRTWIEDQRQQREAAEREIAAQQPRTHSRPFPLGALAREMRLRSIR